MMNNHHNDFENKYGKSIFPKVNLPKTQEILLHLKLLIWRLFYCFVIIGEAPDNDYRNKGSRTLGKGNTANGMNDDGGEPVDADGRVNKSPFTLRNGATYTG